MALDTRDRRSSAISAGLLFLVSLPDPVSGIDAGDRQHAGATYRGILVAVLTVAAFVPPPTATVTFTSAVAATATQPSLVSATVTQPSNVTATVES